MDEIQGRRGSACRLLLEFKYGATWFQRRRDDQRTPDQLGAYVNVDMAAKGQLFVAGDRETANSHFDHWNDDIAGPKCQSRTVFRSALGILQALKDRFRQMSRHHQTPAITTQHNS